VSCFMISCFIALVTSFGLALVLTPVARRLARRVGLVDRPDGARKTQTEPIPVAGGLVVLISVGLALAVVYFTPWWGSLSQLAGELPLLGLLAGSVGICILGVADDCGRLRGRHKLLGQMVIVAIVIGSGVIVRQVECFGWRIELGVMASPFTAFLLLGAINSLNLIDGMDGLLSCVGAISCASLAAMAALGGHLEAAIVTLALAGALLGFLRYNFPPASIYLGDAGSMLIGLVIGVLAIQTSLKHGAIVALTAPVGLLAIPFFDTAAAILRRKLTGRSIYTTDRGHLHHCLLRQGWSTRWTLLLISLLCLITAIGTLVSLALRNEMVAVVSVLSVLGVLVAGRLFGHAELRLLVKRLAAIGASLTRFPSQGQGRGYEVHLQGTIDWGSLWSAIHIRSSELGLRSVRLDINLPALHENYHASWHQPADDGGAAEDAWRAEIPLTMRGRTFGRIAVTGQRNGEPIWRTIASLSRLSEEFALAHQVFNGATDARVHLGIERENSFSGSNGVAKPHPNGVAKPHPNGVAKPHPNGALRRDPIDVTGG
jgi:UDP-GlcNAc:undecaprenyl-phosphate GlcNAc-1-phosphate transferase